MFKNFVEMLKGAIDIYYHIDKKKIIIFLEHLLGG